MPKATVKKGKGQDRDQSWRVSDGEPYVPLLGVRSKLAPWPRATYMKEEPSAALGILEIVAS
jgi:hypothetical protein